jgi:serine/threonine protein kinase
LRYDHLMLKDFRIFKYLGCGGFSKVYLGYCKRDRKICVLKFIEKNKMERNKMLKILGNEKDILFSIDH